MSNFIKNLIDINYWHGLQIGAIRGLEYRIAGAEVGAWEDLTGHGFNRNS